jgi:uncharacterized membrane protein YccC
MSEGTAGLTSSGIGKALARQGGVLTKELEAGAQPLLFGLRLWVSVCLALYIAFYLELDNAFWAGTSAAIVCQPQLGASLRKGWFRLVGTVAGAIFIVLLTAAFPQQRVAFLGALALWGGVCAYAATQLKNFASYAAALAGYTAVIVASDTLGATGGSDGRVFLLAVERASEISIGIVSAGIVLAGTDLGSAPRQLARSVASLLCEIMSEFTRMMTRAGPDMPDTQPQRRDLVRRTIALDPVIDQAIGESSELRYHSPILQNTVRGLFLAVDGWRTVAVHLAQLPGEQAQREARTVLDALPAELRSVFAATSDSRWLTQTVNLRAACTRAIRNLLALPATTPSLRLVADRTAKTLAGVQRVLDGLALLVEAPSRAFADKQKFELGVPDRLPAIVNAARAAIAIAAAALFWVVTAWPSGGMAMTFVAIAVLLLAPRGDLAPMGAIAFAVGTAIAVPFAATVKFAVLPSYETFFAFSLALGAYLVPVGFGVARWSTRPALSLIFMVMAFNFVPLLAPQNEISYNTLQFYNSALAIFGGCAGAALAFYLIPPLPPQLRARRLLALAQRDLRKAITASRPPTLKEWEQSIYGLLAAMPDASEPVQRSQLIAALCVGSEVIRLRRLSRFIALQPELDAALSALADGDCDRALFLLDQLDDRLGSRDAPHPTRRLRARARMLVITEAIKQHLTFFQGGSAP